VQIVASEFRVAISMSDLVVWSGEDDDDFSPHPALVSLLATLGFSFSIRDLYVLYFDRTPVGSGDVHVFRTKSADTNVFAIDMYRDSTDQLDIIALGVRCEELMTPVVKRDLRSLFDSASCQCRFEEANCSVAFRSMIDATKFPVSVGEHGYQQNLIIHYDG
jgi:hypothetical protein